MFLVREIIDRLRRALILCSATARYRRRCVGNAGTQGSFENYIVFVYLDRAIAQQIVNVWHL